MERDNEHIQGQEQVMFLSNRAFYKVYANSNSNYLISVDMGSPFVIPVSKVISKRRKIVYIPTEPKIKTRFVIFTDGSYAGASIIDLDNRYIVYASSHNNTIIHDHLELENQIRLNYEFQPLLLLPELVKEIYKNGLIIRIYKVGKIGNKNVYVNDYATNRDYIPNLEEFDFSNKKDVFIEFIKKEKCYVIKNWREISFI